MFAGSQRIGRRTLLLALSATLAACVVAPAQPVAPAAPLIGVRIAPPPAQVEVIPVAPAPHWYWIGGHWRWDGQRYVWAPGHWVEPRPNEVFVPARWVFEGGVWVYRPGYWRRVEALPATAAGVSVTVTVPPPMARQEVMPPAPGPANFWISGHWRWEGNAHVWVPGHWEAERPGYHWVPAHWVPVGPAWRYVPGHWQIN